MGRNGNPGVYPDLRSGTKGCIVFTGSFTTAGTGTPTVPKGQGYTVTRIGVGRFRVAFDRAFRTALYMNAMPIAVANIAVCVAFTPGSLRTGASADIEIQSAIGTATETTGVVVMFTATFQNVVDHRGK